jgi:hypothetical protein
LVEYPPSNTLYINNLFEKVPIDELKEALSKVFEEFGEILNVIAISLRSSQKETFVCEDRLSSSLKISTQLWRPGTKCSQKNCTAKKW